MFVIVKGIWREEGMQLKCILCMRQQDMLYLAVIKI